MRIKVLGTGSSGNAYLLQSESDSLLLDCGVPVKTVYNSIGYDFSKLDGILITHGHGDHAQSVKHFIEQYVDVLMTGNTRTGIGLKYFHPNVHTDSSVVFKNWHIKMFSLEHDTDNAGFYIYHTNTKKKIVYMTDTGFVRSVPVGVNVLITECNYIERLIQKEENGQYLRLKQAHMSLERLLSYLSKIDISCLTHIVLVHLSDRNSDEREMIERIQELTKVQVVAANTGEDIIL